jgi:hypothetical protein
MGSVKACGSAFICGDDDGLVLCFVVKGLVKLAGVENGAVAG